MLFDSERGRFRYESREPGCLWPYPAAGVHTKKGRPLRPALFSASFDSGKLFLFVPERIQEARVKLPALENRRLHDLLVEGDGGFYPGNDKLVKRP